MINNMWNLEILQVAVDHQCREKKGQINDRGDKKTFGCTVPIFSERKIQRSQHDEKSQKDCTDEIKVARDFITLTQIEKIRSKNEKVV